MYRFQFRAFMAVLVFTIVFRFYVAVEDTKTTYKNEEYIVHTSFKDEIYMVVNVVNNNELAAKLIRYDTALENGLIIKSSSVFRKFDIDGEKIIKYVAEL